MSISQQKPEQPQTLAEWWKEDAKRVSDAGDIVLKYGLNDEDEIDEDDDEDEEDEDDDLDDEDDEDPDEDDDDFEDDDEDDTGEFDPD